MGFIQGEINQSVSSTQYDLQYGDKKPWWAYGRHAWLGDNIHILIKQK